MGELLYEKLTYQIRGALFEVYNTLGPGFREETYKIATLADMRRRGIRTARELAIEIQFKGEIIDTYRLDIVVEGQVISNNHSPESVSSVLSVESVYEGNLNVSTRLPQSQLP